MEDNLTPRECKLTYTRDLGDWRAGQAFGGASDAISAKATRYGITREGSLLYLLLASFP